MAIYYVTKQTKLEGSNSDIIYLNTTDMLHKWFKNNFKVGCDTETMGFDPYACKLLCVQFGDETDQFVVNTEEFNILEFKSYFEDSKWVFIFHNAKFDLKFLLHAGINVSVVMDTFLAECILTTGYERKDRKLGLDAVAEKYTGVLLSKEVRGSIHKEGLTARVIRYSANDVKHLHKIIEKQLELIYGYGMREVALLEFKVVKVFARMEYDGVGFDSTNWSNIATITEQNSANLADKLDDEIIVQSKTNTKLVRYLNNQLDLFSNGAKTRINWGSPAQKKEILTNCGLNMSDGVGDRELQRNKKKNILIPLMIDYSKQAKLANAFGKNFLKFVNPVSKRIHYNVWQILNTGRISVSEPNLNQIPSRGDLASQIRASFIPREGYKIVGGDYSGMELRIIAEFSKDPLWVDAFKNGEDLHSVLCSKTFDIPIEDVKKPFPEKPEMKYRDVQKTINFGLAYGMSEFKLADTMQIDVKEAKKIINKFFSVVPEVQKFLEVCANYGMKKGFIKTAKPFSRMRWFPRWEKAYNSNNEYELSAIGRASKNTPIQGSNGDVIKLALIKTQEYIEENNYPAMIILSVYDEIQTECREDKAEEWKGILDSIMIEAAQAVLKEVPVTVDCAINEFWAK